MPLYYSKTVRGIFHAKITPMAGTKVEQASRVYKEILSPKLIDFDKVIRHFSSLDSSKMYSRDWARRYLDSADQKHKYWIIGKCPPQTIKKILLPDHQHDWGGRSEKSKWLIPPSGASAEETAQRYVGIKDGSNATECVSKIENLQTAIKKGEDVGPLFLRDDDHNAFCHIDCVHRAIAYSLLVKRGVEFDLPVAIIATNSLSRFNLRDSVETNKD